jgi:hypothetical protein
MLRAGQQQAREPVHTVRAAVARGHQHGQRLRAEHVQRAVVEARLGGLAGAGQRAGRGLGRNAVALRARGAGRVAPRGVARGGGGARARLRAQPRRAGRVGRVAATAAGGLRGGAREGAQPASRGVARLPRRPARSPRCGSPERLGRGQLGCAPARATQRLPTPENLRRADPTLPYLLPSQPQPPPCSPHLSIGALAVGRPHRPALEQPRRQHRLPRLLGGQQVRHAARQHRHGPRRRGAARTAATRQ